MGLVNHQCGRGEKSRDTPKLLACDAVGRSTAGVGLDRLAIRKIIARSTMMLTLMGTI